MSGVGKTTLLLAESLALGLGRELLGVMPRERAPVWYMGLRTRLRNMSGALPPRLRGDDLQRSLFLNSGRDQDFIIAVEEKSGIRLVTPVVDAIIANVKRHGICQIVVDPFVAFYAVSENDNVKLEKSPASGLALLTPPTAPSTSCITSARSAALALSLRPKMFAARVRSLARLAPSACSPA